MARIGFILCQELKSKQPLYMIWIKQTGLLIIHTRNIPFFRHRVIVDKDGYFVTMGEVSKMCLIKPSVTGDSLQLQAEGMPTLTLPIEPPLSAPCVDAK